MTFLTVLAYLFNLTVLVFVTWWLYNRVKDNALGGLFIPGLLFKLACGIGLGLVYTYYYRHGDTNRFFEEAVILTNIAYESPIDFLKILLINDIPREANQVLQLSQQPRAFFTAKLLSIVNIFTYNNYWLSSLYFSYFAYSGMWYLASMLVRTFPKTAAAAAIAFLFFPSVVFWSSGILKESFVMGFISYIVAFSLPYLVLSKKIPYYKIVLMVFFLYALLKLKYYYVGVLIPIMTANFVVAYLRLNYKFINRNYYTHLGSWLVVFISVLLLSTTIHPNLKIGNFLTQMVTNHNLIYESSMPEDLIIYYKLDPTWQSILINLPLAIYSGLFRPTVLDAHTSLQYWVGFENLLLMILLIFSLFRLKNFVKFKYKNLVFSTFVYIMIMATFMAISSPNFGTLVRYKIGFLPFFIYLICADNPIIDAVQKRLNLSKSS
ncbi:hypothetical protein QQ008_04570 [Fulvivirgaceae bacterium BMA10]|uniref:Glycosyltransferase RgtA/B/C/D-like domain-containing protein n=1 Tax=Splendidivirga corallicola TaxID=3051826 RepID=A0ABT8KIS9_9BACT|nr:hypothetical protein [Fulvivirgaceae bacterium BMA10]